MNTLDIRALRPGDERELESFLTGRLSSSLFLLSNSRAVGLEEGDRPYQGTYMGAFRSGELCSVAAHYWNGNIILQAPELLEEVLGGLGRCSRRPIRGLVGPWEQVESAREALGVSRAGCRLDGEEVLFEVPLDDLKLPPALETGELGYRRAEPPETELLTRWRHDYLVEIGGEDPGDALMEDAREMVARLIREGTLFVLTRGGEVVACSAFNARLPEVVQIGGVFTPPALRSQGYGRAVVAGSLQAAKAEGVQSSVLFTPVGNVAAQRAYQAIGYREVGRYGLVRFREEQPFPG